MPSNLYSLSFAPNPGWTRAYSSQPEILAYVEDCYYRLDVRRKVRLGVTVTEARWSGKPRAGCFVSGVGGLVHVVVDIEDRKAELA